MLVELDDPRLTAMELLGNAYGVLSARLTELLQQNHRISISEFDVLKNCIAYQERQLFMADLARLTRLTTSGMSRVVARMEDVGLVRRELDDRDRRRWYAVITDEGRARHTAAAADLLVFTQKMITDRLEPAALVEMLRALHVIDRAALQEQLPVCRRR